MQKLKSINISENMECRNFIFVLVNNFSLIAFSSAIEPLRLANRVSGNEIYRWSVCSSTIDKEVKCSNGTILHATNVLPEIKKEDTIIICGGTDIMENTSNSLLAWLRKEARKGVGIGGLCTGSYTLAKAGLLTEKQCTIHWENRESFLEEFPAIELSNRVFTVDRNRFCAAGGTASTDLMLSLISNQHGPELSNLVADQMIYSSIRTDQDEQRLSIPTRIGVRNPKLAKVIGNMEENLEDPISPSLLAARAGMSTRQLERLFRRYLFRSPKKYYMELRLQKARSLLLQTNMSVINVALACGFTSPSHFSKCYRSHFLTTPYRERGSKDFNIEAKI